MPYLQLDLDAKAAVPKVARALGVVDAVAGWGLLELWEWCWRAETDEVTAAHLPGFFGGNGDTIAVALAAFGFLEARGEAWRVRGASRYLRIVEHQREAGKARAARAARDPAGRLLPAENQPRTPAGLQPDSSRQPALTPITDPPITEKKKIPRASKKTDAPPDPRHAPLVESLTLAAQVHDPGWRFSGGRAAKAVTGLLSLGDPDEVLRRWGRAWTRDGFPRVRQPWELVSHWGHFGDDCNSQKDVRKGIVRAEDMDGKHGPGGPTDF